MKPGWLNNNLNRAFPFIKGTVHDPLSPADTIEGMSNQAIVDAGFIAGLNAGFVNGLHSVFLQQVQRVGDTFYFSFASDAPGLSGCLLTFSRNLGDASPYQTEYVEVDDEPASLPSIGVSSCIQFGSSGTFTATENGMLRFYFNDDYFAGNSGSFYIMIAGQVYAVPATAVDGVNGPVVVAGQSYSYTATGTAQWNTSVTSTVTPDGVAADPSRLDIVCPGLELYSLVGKLKPTPSHNAAASCGGEPLLSGYLTTGRLTELAAALADGGTMTRGTGGIVEPALTQNMADSYVSTLNVANADRTRVTSPAGCDPIAWPFTPGQIFVNASCLVGHVRFKAGYNAVISQQTATNQIVIGAAVGAGEGQPCDEVSLFSGESPPSGSSLLEGGPRCNEVLLSINGIGGQYGEILSGPGVTVTQATSQSKIIIDVDTSQLAVCYTDSAFSAISQHV